MSKEDLKKALDNNRRCIEDKLKNLVEEKNFDEIFLMFEKYFKYKERIDKMEDTLK